MTYNADIYYYLWNKLFILFTFVTRKRCFRYNAFSLPMHLCSLPCEHILICICLTVNALVFDNAVLHQHMGAVTQLMAHAVALKVLGIETVDGVEGKSLAIGAYGLKISQNLYKILQERVLTERSTER